MVRWFAETFESFVRGCTNGRYGSPPPVSAQLAAERTVRSNYKPWLIFPKTSSVRRSPVSHVYLLIYVIFSCSDFTIVLKDNSTKYFVYYCNPLYVEKRVLYSCREWSVRIVLWVACPAPAITPNVSYYIPPTYLPNEQTNKKTISCKVFVNFWQNITSPWNLRDFQRIYGEKRSFGVGNVLGLFRCVRRFACDAVGDGNERERDKAREETILGFTVFRMIFIFSFSRRTLTFGALINYLTRVTTASDILHFRSFELWRRQFVCPFPGLTPFFSHRWFDRA